MEDPPSDCLSSSEFHNGDLILMTFIPDGDVILECHGEARTVEAPIV
jgi:hypothetical protein